MARVQSSLDIAIDRPLGTSLVGEFHLHERICRRWIGQTCVYTSAGKKKLNQGINILMTEQTQAVVIGAQSNISRQANQLTIQLPSVWNAQDSQVALASLYIYFSWRNITAAFTNNSCSYRWVDGVTYPVAFPDGYYSPSDISGFIQFVMQNNGHYLVDNTGTNQFYLSIQTNSVYYADTITSTCIPTVLPTGWTNPHAVPLNGLQP